MSRLKRTRSIGKEFSFKLIFVAAAALMVFPHLTYAVGRGSWMTGLKDLGGAETGSGAYNIAKWASKEI